MTQRTALVTGANRGIGRAICEALVARSDIKVLAAARTQAAADKAARALGGKTVGVALGLSDPDRVERRAEEIAAEHGPIDILVNNAGILHDSEPLDTPTDEMLRSLAVNTVAPFILIRTLGTRMKERGWGRIVNLSSSWGAFSEGLEGPIDYGVSKAALNALTVSFARALGQDVKVNAADPGWVRTDMGGKDAPSSPAEGADTAVWLATLPDGGPTGGFFRRRKPIDW